LKGDIKHRSDLLRICFELRQPNYFLNLLRLEGVGNSAKCAAHFKLKVKAARTTVNVPTTGHAFIHNSMLVGLQEWPPK
jgi:hypothetical protein